MKLPRSYQTGGAAHRCKKSVNGLVAMTCLFPAHVAKAKAFHRNVSTESIMSIKHRKTIIIPGYGFKAFYEASDTAIEIDDTGERQVPISGVWDEFCSGLSASIAAKKSESKVVAESEPIRGQSAVGDKETRIGRSLDVREVAKLLGCSVKTVHNLCDKGQLNSHWVGNRRMFRHEDVLEFWEAQKILSVRGSATHVDAKKGSRVPFSKSHAYESNRKGGVKKNDEKANNGTEAEILASIRERMREWD
jgi:excisionase family DNA binding protein